MICASNVWYTVSFHEKIGLLVALDSKAAILRLTVNGITVLKEGTTTVLTTRSI